MNGGMRLVVAGNVVKLTKSNLTEISGGWQVSVTLNSTVLQDISANVPWYFETKDGAGNSRRTSSNVEFEGTAINTNMVTSVRFMGSLPIGTFGGSSIKASKGSLSNVMLR